MGDIDLLQRLDAIVWEADAQTLRFSFVTQVAAALLGFTVDEWIEDAQFFAHHLHPEDRDAALALCAGVARDGADRQGDHRMIGRTGAVRWFRTVVHGIAAGDGPVESLLGMMVDITAQKKTEAAMHAAEERVRTVVNSAPLILMALDSDGIFTLCEGSGLALLGLHPGEVVGKSVFARFGADPHIAASVRRALAGESFSSVDTVRALGLWWETYWTPLYDGDGKLSGTVGVATNITERVRSEQERGWLLEASRILASSLEYEETLNAIARLALPLLADWCTVDILERDGVVRRVASVHHDPQMDALAQQIAAFVPSLGDSFGSARALRDGEPILFNDIVLPAEVPEGMRPHHMELVRALKLRAYLTVPMIAHGETLGAISFGLAREGMRYGEAELALARDLAGRAALAIENARLYRDSRDAVRLREEFLSVASHELRTPVTSLQIAVQGLLEIEGAPPPSLLAQALRSAERQSRRLGKLADALLDVSRIQAGRLSLQRELIDLAQLAEEGAAAMAKDLERAGCALSVRSVGKVMGRWDRARLEQVITNLLSNAAKYGAGTAVELSVTGDGARARLAVKDGGIGIAPDEQARIFERFERAVPERHYGGLGLGLYIVRSIVAAHGGTIRVESALGRGSSFIVELPAAVE